MIVFTKLICLMLLAIVAVFVLISSSIQVRDITNRMTVTSNSYSSTLVLSQNWSKPKSNTRRTHFPYMGNNNSIDNNHEPVQARKTYDSPRFTVDTTIPTNAKNSETTSSAQNDAKLIDWKQLLAKDSKNTVKEDKKDYKQSGVVESNNKIDITKSNSYDDSKNKVKKQEKSYNVKQQLAQPESQSKVKPSLDSLSSLDRRKINFPPLRTILNNKNYTIIDDKNIVGDVRFLLDFAILGHAKCATSYIMKWFNAHPLMRIWDYEVCDLYDNHPALLARKLYQDFPPNDHDSSKSPEILYRGFKCPGHFSRRALRYFRRYFSNTKLIVGLRHPVLWFESYYNFRHRHQRPGMVLPDATELMNLHTCLPEAQGACLEHAQFHQHLAMFGKTNMSQTFEWELLEGLHSKYKHLSSIDNPVFLYDMQQLYDTNVTRQDKFRLDLTDFLGLPQALPSSSDYKDTDRSGHKSSHIKERRIDICDDRFVELRNELLKIGDRASTWIRKSFLQAPTVHVSSQSFFEAALKEWALDPCVNGKRTNIGLGSGGLVEQE